MHPFVSQCARRPIDQSLFGLGVCTLLASLGQDGRERTTGLTGCGGQAQARYLYNLSKGGEKGFNHSQPGL